MIQTDDGLVLRAKQGVTGSLIVYEASLNEHKHRDMLESIRESCICLNVSNHPACLSKEVISDWYRENECPCRNKQLFFLQFKFLFATIKI